MRNSKFIFILLIAIIGCGLPRISSDRIDLTGKYENSAENVSSHLNFRKRLLFTKERKQPPPQSNIIRNEKIHIGLTIDAYSFKDALILMNSVLLSAINPERISFHLVTCDQTMPLAQKLQSDLENIIRQCLTRDFQFHYEIVPFILPEESGFKKQLVSKLLKNKNHWNSPTGTDMIRFYLPSLFPTVPKLLYFDNDIVVTCCLEEIYFTSLSGEEEDGSVEPSGARRSTHTGGCILGIALDDLHWATITQFQRHYNRSHPLVVHHMRGRKEQSSGQGSGRGAPKENNQKDPNRPIEDQEFFSAVPRYPNDGVLLFNVSAYNSHHILDQMNELATLNSRDYIINLGTQQFTVLAMHDSWKELTPRANLRQFPNMARGYLMWFYYHGVIHYAGMFKPKLLCAYTSGRYKENHLRVMTYTAFLQSHVALQQQCFPERFPREESSKLIGKTNADLNKAAILSSSSSLSAAVSLAIKGIDSFQYDSYFHSQCSAPLFSSSTSTSTSTSTSSSAPSSSDHGHLVQARNLYELMVLLRMMLSSFNDESYLLLWFGNDIRPTVTTGSGTTTTVVGWKYEEYQQLINEKYSLPKLFALSHLVNVSFHETFLREYSTASSSSFTGTTVAEKELAKHQLFYSDVLSSCDSASSPSSSLLQFLYQMILFDSNWSFRLFHSLHSATTLASPTSNSRSHQEKVIQGEYEWLFQSIQSFPNKETNLFYKNILYKENRVLFEQYNPRDTTTTVTTTTKKKKGASASTTQERTFHISFDPFCYKPNSTVFLERENLSAVAEPIPFYSPVNGKQQEKMISNENCKDVLQEIKKEGKKHWEIMGIVFSTASGLSIQEMEYLLYGLDLIFMRPKFILLEFKVINSGTNNNNDKEEEKEATIVKKSVIESINRVMKYLRRTGYLANHSFDEKNPFATTSDNGTKNNNSKEKVRCSVKENGKQIETVYYVWGIRMNLFEL
jgi:lipopolysaccharide biosynthesis glycosyltransferase